MTDEQEVLKAELAKKHKENTYDNALFVMGIRRQLQEMEGEEFVQKRAKSLDAVVQDEKRLPYRRRTVQTDDTLGVDT